MNKQLKKGQTIYFIGEIAGFEIKAINEKFAVCSREMHIEHDEQLLENEVERGAYSTFDEAYESLKEYPVYTCIDFENEKKNRHNLIFNPYDFTNDEDCEKLLSDLTNGDTELSKRGIYDLMIDWERIN